MAVHSTPTVRRHDIDWLRVILFGLLIPFHVAIGIYWSTYGADVNPNIDEISAVDGRGSPRRTTTTPRVGRLHQHGPTLDAPVEAHAYS